MLSTGLTILGHFMPVRAQLFDLGMLDGVQFKLDSDASRT